MAEGPPPVKVPTLQAQPAPTRLTVFPDQESEAEHARWRENMESAMKVQELTAQQNREKETNKGKTAQLILKPEQSNQSNPVAIRLTVMSDPASLNNHATKSKTSVNHPLQHTQNVLSQHVDPSFEVEDIVHNVEIIFIERRY